MRTLFRKLTKPEAPANLVDEFWAQLYAMPRSQIEAAKRHATWMLHHPIDVALALTHLYLKDITGADDQLKAFAQFWVPTDTERCNRLYLKLSKQACWERTSWIPFSQKVPVLPARYAHDAFMFSALAATETPHVYGHVSGRYTNAAPTASSFCKNNCRPPIVDGKWLPSEVLVLTRYLEVDPPPPPSLMTTVRLLRSMILTLLSPSGHVSFVVGIPTLFDNRIGFHCFDTIPRKFENTVEVPAWKPRERAEAPRSRYDAVRGSDSRPSEAPHHAGVRHSGDVSHNSARAGTRTIDQLNLTGIHYHGNVRQQGGMTVADVVLAATIADTLNSPAYKIGRQGDDAVASDIAHGLSISDPAPSYREPDPSPVCRDDSPSTSWGSESSSNCNVD